MDKTYRRLTSPSLSASLGSSVVLVWMSVVVVDGGGFSVPYTQTTYSLSFTYFVPSEGGEFWLNFPMGRPVRSGLDAPGCDPLRDCPRKIDTKIYPLFLPLPGHDPRVAVGVTGAWSRCGGGSSIRRKRITYSLCRSICGRPGRPSRGSSPLPGVPLPFPSCSPAPRGI